MECEHFERVVAENGGVFVREPGGYHVALQSFNNPRPRTRVRVTLRDIEGNDPVIWGHLSGALRQAGDDLRATYAGILRQERNDVIAQHSVM
jgi:hypothetical protein